MTAPQSVVNSSCSAETIQPLIDYSITRIMHMTREELRAQRLHDIANAFEDAFDALEARSMP
jgi:hypothetical protein